MTREYSMTIDGKPTAAGASFEVRNPATGAVIASAPECSAEQVDRAMRAAAEALASWRRDPAARRDSLTRLAAKIEQDGEALARTITAEQGKPLAESRSELRDCVNDLRYFAGLTLEDDVVGDGPAFVRVVRRPVGVVAGITPWNFPLGTAIAKIAPGLAAGCTMVVKPSPFTPLACLELGELSRDILPPGVLNMLSGGDQVGAWMSEHPTPRMVSFTGSIATGKRIASAVAPDLKRLTLELGGNDPAVLLDDVEVADVADALFANAFANCGQVCVAVKRVYVPERLHGDVVAALADRAKTTRVGDGGSEDTQIGPLCNRPQFERVSELVRAAVDGGAQVAAGGEPIDGPGYFFQPTVLSGVDEDTRIVSEEQFGPALPVLPYRDVEDAIRRANATHFGLGASIWTADPQRGSSLATELEAGTVWVNTHQDAIPGQPFGGLKWSGTGVEGGRWGLHSFTDLQVVHVRRRGE